MDFEHLRSFLDFFISAVGKVKLDLLGKEAFFFKYNSHTHTQILTFKHFIIVLDHDSYIFC